MQPRSSPFTLLILSLLHYYRATTAFVIPSGDAINNPDYIPAVNSNNNIVTISPNDQPSQFEVADSFFGAPAQDTGNLNDGVGAAAAGILQIIQQGLDNAKPLPNIPDNPTVKKDGEPLRTTAMQRLAPGDQFCPLSRFGPRRKPVCDTGSLIDVQYVFPVKSWTLKFATIMYVPTMCPPASLQVYWCCVDVGNKKVIDTLAQNCEPFEHDLNPQLVPLLQLGTFQPPGTDTDPQEEFRK